MEKAVQEEKACSFKPKINKRKNFSNKEIAFAASNENNPPTKTKEQRLEFMYEKGKHNQLEKVNKKKDEIEFENNKNQYTFKPILNEK